MPDESANEPKPASPNNARRRKAERVESCCAIGVVACYALMVPAAVATAVIALFFFGAAWTSAFILAFLTIMAFKVAVEIFERTEQRFGTRRKKPRPGLWWLWDTLAGQLILVTVSVAAILAILAVW